MLGQKEICGLMIILCCSLARPSNNKNCHNCRACLREEADNLESATKDFVDFSDNSSVIRNIRAQLPSCKSSWDFSRIETHSIVKAFHTLFQQLSATMEDAKYIEGLKTNLEQQEACLSHWNVSSSPINTTCEETTKEGRKICLVKASEHYNCLMQQVREF